MDRMLYVSNNMLYLQQKSAAIAAAPGNFASATSRTAVHQRKSIFSTAEWRA